MVFAIILFVLLMFSMLLNLGSFASSLLAPSGHYTRVGGPKLEEVIIEDNDAAAKIGVVKIEGIITSQPMDGPYSMVEVIRSQLKRAAEDSRVKALVLKVDSPGGEVLASDEIYRMIVDFQTKSRKPVVASMGTLAASGGYYVSAPCRWIVANELTLTGSIGVILQSWNYRGLMNKVGLRPEVYKSGRFKDMLSGSREPDEISPDERKMLQALIDETYGRFKEVVMKGRETAYENQKGGHKGKKLAQDWTDYADGRVLMGGEAFKLGFVDELGNFRDAVQRAEKLAGVARANLIEYQQHFDLSDIFRMFGKTEAAALKVDLGMELPRLQPGQLYFLSPTLLH